MSFWLILLIIAHLVQAYFWLWVYRKTPLSYDQQELALDSLPGVSVVIAVKDELENLSRHLPIILSQDFSNYEVIIVDDHSKDNSSLLLQQFALKNSNLVLLSAEAEHGKKGALSLGIKKAKYPWILCTDADCIPNGNQWIKHMMRQEGSSDMILGYGPYHPKSTLLSAFVNYETWYIAMQYMSAALHGRAYMGVGRNLAFRKKLWEEVGGYKSHMNLRSGDDDLFVNAVGNKRIRIETDSKSWTHSISPNSLGELWQQKRRHLTTASSYSLKNKTLLALSFFSAFTIYTLSAYLCYSGSYFVLVLLLFRCLYLYMVSYHWMKRLGALKLWSTVPFWDLLLVFYYSIQGFFLLNPKKDW